MKPIPTWPIPADEAKRLEDLRELEVLDTPRESSFDGIAEIAAELFDAPMAAVTLIDEDRQWFKSETGLDCEETGREVSMGAYAILGTETMVVEDASKDDRFHDNPLVKEPGGIRFYVGVPLRTFRGHCVGALCVFDTHARKAPIRLIRLLERLASLAVDALEHGRRIRR
jgi:GAF domain-containing protein